MPDAIVWENLATIAVDSNKTVKAEDRAIHDWYRFVLSYRTHRVRGYLQDFGLGPGSTVLDPFCGMGATVVET